MSQNPFEAKIGKWLRAIPNSLTYHPPDYLKARLWKPADFMFMHHNGWALIECKQVSKGNFPLSSWTAQQRQFCSQTLTAGGVGTYWLVVHFRQLGLMSAIVMLPGDLVRNGSLVPSNGAIFESQAGFQRILLNF